ncbi:hypothetical protein DPMN_076382 [Dreissena polymorpha]|uniref:Uncharacterized protein n=1 Tax=Dreissena polymorpha TaxID=45954 RepID=A0A9D3YIL8_DREPO|nr:hypothetical protein DPMN_076369 [Dreissena polymorpha]KAH3701396.1 hypothetical protein DPMN_076382 [Dreissena polymorpha]
MKCLLTRRFICCSITVTDSKNVSAPILDIVIVVCSLCSGHGTCNTSVFREAQGNPNHKLATCQCEPYWTGQRSFT